MPRAGRPYAPSPSFVPCDCDMLGVLCHHPLFSRHTHSLHIPFTSLHTSVIPPPTAHPCEFFPILSRACTVRSVLRGLRPAPRSAHTLRGIPHMPGMDVRLAGEALPLRVRGPHVPPPGRCGFYSTAVTASRPQTPWPRPSPCLSRAPARLVRTDKQSGIRQPRYRQSSGVIIHMRTRTPLAWSRGDSNISHPSGQHTHRDDSSMDTRRCLTDTCWLTSVPRYGGPQGLPPAAWGRHLPLIGQWVAPLEKTFASSAG